MTVMVSMMPMRKNESRAMMVAVLQDDEADKEATN